MTINRILLDVYGLSEGVLFAVEVFIEECEISNHVVGSKSLKKVEILLLKCSGRVSQKVHILELQSRPYSSILLCRLLKPDKWFNRNSF